MPPLQKQQQFLRSTGIGRTFAQILMHIHMNREVLKAILLCAVGLLLASCAGRKRLTPIKNENGQYECKMKGKTYLFPYRHSGGEPVFVDGQAVAILNGKWGVLDEWGHAVHPFIYDWISEKGEHGVEDQYLVKVGSIDPERKFYISGGKTGIVDKQGRVVLPPSYVAIYPTVSFGLMMVNDGASVEVGEGAARFDGLFGYINQEGTTVIPCAYEEASPAFDEAGTTWVRKAGHWGKIDTLGRVVEPFVHDSVGR